MRISYRQGIISAQTNFLQIGQNSNYIDLVVNPIPTIVAFASESKDYLISEQRTVTNAWGPFTGPDTQYLYWDINLQTGQVTRGSTILSPVISADAPLSPAVNQMWWNSTTLKMHFWNGARWQYVLRVFAGTLSSGSILSPMGFVSQVNLNTSSEAGYIVTDAVGIPFRDSEGNFLTTETAIASNDTGSVVKLNGVEVIGMANENIPKFTAVYIINGRFARASSLPPDNIEKAPIGLVTTDVLQNDTVGIATTGRQVSNDQWSWSLSDIGKQVYCDAFGAITTIKPNSYKNVRVGTIVSEKSVLLNLDWETDIILANTGISGVAANSPLMVSGSVDYPVVSIQQASTSQDGYISASDFERIEIVEDALIAKANVIHLHEISDVTGLQAALDTKANSVHSHIIADTTGLQAAIDAKANTAHTHVIADTTGLQSALDALAVSISTRIAKVPGAVDGNIATFSVGSLADSGFTIASFALSSHTHEIADTTGLQTALDSKADSVHAHAIANVTNLQSTLDLKADIVHSHAISDISFLQSTLDLKSNLGHTHAIADVVDLQSILDLKVEASHTHLIADIIGLQAALDTKASISHTHVIAEVSGLQTALNTKSNIGHGHIISDIAGLQTELDLKTTVGHTHVIADTTGLQVALDNKANSVHSHAISDVTDLQLELNGKANTVHSHVISDITGLQTSLNDKADSVHAHLISDVTDLQTELDNKSDVSHNHTLDSLSDVSITSPNNGDVVTWNGGAWEASPVPGAGTSPESMGFYLSALSDLTANGNFFTDWFAGPINTVSPPSFTIDDSIPGVLGFTCETAGLWEITVMVNMFTASGTLPEEYLGYGIEMEITGGDSPYPSSYFQRYTPPTGVNTNNSVSTSAPAAIQDIAKRVRPTVVFLWNTTANQKIYPKCFMYSPGFSSTIINAAGAISFRYLGQ